LALGPRYVLLKKGEHGSLLFSKDSTFVMPAFPLNGVEDPTGAGDSFAGGFIGALAEQKEISESSLRQALVHGNVVASFGVESFSLDTLQKLERTHIDERISLFRSMIHIP